MVPLAGVGPGVGQGRDHPLGEELDRLDVEPGGGAEDDVLPADPSVVAEDVDQLLRSPDQRRFHSGAASADRRPWQPSWLIPSLEYTLLRR